MRTMGLPVSLRFGISLRSTLRTLANFRNAMLKLELVAHRFDAGLGAGGVGVPTRPARHTNGAQRAAARSAHDAAAEDYRAGPTPHASLRHAGLRHGDQIRGVASEADRS